MNIDQTISKYHTLREEIANKKKEFEAFKTSREMEMKAIESELLDLSNLMGLSAFSNDTHTAFRTTKKFVSSNKIDPTARDKLNAYVLKTKDFDIFTAAVSKNHAIELMEDGIELSSIGLAYTEVGVMQIRKK